MGAGFTLALLVMSTIREVLGAGTWAGIEIPFLVNFKIPILTMAPGGFLVYGILIAVVNAATKGKGVKKKSFGCQGCPSASFCHSADTGACEKSLKEEKENV